MKKIYSIILTAVLLCCGTSLWGDDLTLTVMDDDWTVQYVPVNGYGLDGSGGQHNQILLLASELSAMDGGSIKGLKFYFNRTGHSWSNTSNIPNVTFRLAEVETTTLTSQISVDESFTQVYSGAINFDFTSKEFTVTFDDPYSYNGGNLLIDIQTTAGAYVKTSSGNYMKFFAANVSGRALYGSTAQSYCPQTTFTYEEAAVVGGCNKPKNLAISTELPDGATFTWEQNVDETVYQWACVASGDAVEAWNMLAENVRTKTVEGLTAGTAYDFYVRSYCGEGEDKQSDAVKKTFTPSCPAPTYPATPVTAKAATTATITWNAADGISKYQYICVEKNAAQDWSKLNEVATTSADLTGLTAYTEYDFYVRSWYSATSISDAVKTTFRTECAAVNAPYAWNFEDATAGATPGCWDNSASTAVPGFGSDDYNWTAYSYSSNKSLRMYNSYLKKDGISLINTPSIVLPASPAQELAFTYSHRASCGDFMVKISTDGGANFTDLKSYSRTEANSYNPGTFEEAAISLADYAGETIILQFFATADYDAGAIFVDNVEIRAKSSCPAPKSVLVSNETDHTAVVAWTEKGEATAWKLQTSTDGTNWTDVKDGEEVATITTNPYTLTGLEAETTYYVRVKADCGGETSDWSDASEPFDTKCEAKPIGYSEFFAADTKPACWTIDNWSASDVNAWTTASTSDIGGSGYALRYNAKSLANAAAVMPEIFLEEKAELKFYVRNYYYTYQDSYVIGNVHITDGVTNKEVSFGNNKNLTLKTVDLSAFTGKTVTITFNGMGASTYYTAYIWIDSVTVNYLPVATPTDLAAEAGNASATITWAAVEGAASYNFRYREYNAEPEANWTVENLTANTKSLTELTNGKTYEVQVQAVASANRKSDWTASATFTPVSCPTVTAVTFGAATYNSVVVNWTASAAGTWNLRYKAEGDENWTALAEPIAAQTTTLNNLSTGVAYTVQVKPSCSDAWVAAAEAFTPVYSTPANAAVASITDAAAAASWDAVADAPNGYKYAVVAKDAEVNWASATATNELSAELSGLDALTDYDFYVAAVYGANRGEAAKVSFKTVTIAPKNLEQVGESTTDGASFSWEANGAATKYQWSVDNTNWSDAQTALTATVTGLNAGSSYTFYVRSYYSESVQSAAISLPFTTECATVAIGWSENFGTTAGQKPNCWNIANWGTSANYWTTASDFAKTGQALRYYARTLSSADAITPSIVISDKSELKFYIKNSVGSGSAKVECKVLVNDGTTTTEIADITTRYTTATLQTLDLSAFVGKTITIIFRGVGYDTSGTPYLWIDDVEIAYASVAVPTALAAEPKNQGATVTWESTEEGAKFNLQYRTQGEGDWTVVENLTAKTYTIDGLTNGTEYEVQVQAVVSANRKSDWTASANFTPAACPSVTAVTFGAATYNSVVVNWTASAAGTWDLHYKAGEGEWTLIENINALTTTLNNLTTNAVYTVEVKPTCSDAWVAAASTFTPVYSTPANAAVASITDAAAAASWDAVADAPNGYKYAVVAKDTEVNWASATATNELSAELSGLDALTDYDFYVAAVYGGNLGTAAKVSFKTITIAPANLQQDGASTTSSATFTWEANGAATKYQWSVDNTNWSEAQTELTATAEGLNAGSSYTFYVRSYYSESVQSTAISLAFSTECEAYAVGYAEDFEAGGKPLCWVVDEANWAETFSQGSTGNKWSNRSGSVTHKGNYALYYNSKTSTANSADITLPQIEIDKAAKLLFYLKNNYGVTAEVRVAAEGMETAITALASTGNNFNTLKEIDLSAFIGKTVTIIFHAQGAGTSENSSLAIDDIEIAKVCQKPTNLEASVTVDGAIATWNGDEDQYQYCVVNSGNDPAGWILLDENVKAVTVTGKQEGKAYDLYVRAYCGAANQSEAVMITFTPSKSTGVDNAEAEKKAIKRIENNQLVIIRDGAKYNALGEKIQ